MNKTCLAILISILALTGCSSPIKSHLILPTETASLLDVLGDQQGLTVYESRLLVGHQMRAALLGQANLFPAGQTVGQVIETDRAEEIAQAKKTETERKTEALKPKDIAATEQDVGEQTRRQKIHALAEASRLLEANGFQVGAPPPAIVREINK